MRRVVLILVVLSSALAGLIALRLWTQSRVLAAAAGGSGEIEGVAVDLSSRVGARIVEVAVREGQRVAEGDLLVRLDCAEPEAVLAEAEARLAAARAQAVAAGAQVQASRSSRSAAEAAREAARAQAAALAAQSAAAARQAERLGALSSDVAEATVDQTQASATGLAHQVEAARAQAEASRSQARAAEVGVRAAGAQAEATLAQMRAAEASVKRAELLVAECEIRAPRAAEVAELPHEAGELVSPGAVLARLVDLSEVTATFYLPNAEMAAVRPGAPAVVVADAWPGESFRGTVRTVALEAEFTPRNIQTRTDRDRLVYPVEVVVENPEGKLRAGMPVQVSIEGTGR
jgi:HlyD family secretion protein